ncbi:MAG: hypothetical protein AAGB29_01120 [Planctomycetota bacterium]
MFDLHCIHRHIGEKASRALFVFLISSFSLNLGCSNQEKIHHEASISADKSPANTSADERIIGEWRAGSLADRVVFRDDRTCTKYISETNIQTGRWTKFYRTVTANWNDGWVWTLTETVDPDVFRGSSRKPNENTNPRTFNLTRISSSARPGDWSSLAVENLILKPIEVELNDNDEEEAVRQLEDRLNVYSRAGWRLIVEPRIAYRRGGLGTHFWKITTDADSGNYLFFERTRSEEE